VRSILKNVLSKFRGDELYRLKLASGKICLTYLVLGVLWIYFSDQLVYLLAGSNSAAFQTMSTYKGWFYVAITTLLLYYLINGLFKKVFYLNHNDVLTGLFNRNYFEVQQKNLNSNSVLPISVIMADINELKIVNDALGHLTGDEMLKLAASAIRSACRNEDIQIRWGGDEFLVLLKNTNSDIARQMASKIKHACDKESIGTIHLNVSLGWDTKSDQSYPLSSAIKNAEDMMYRNKLVEKRGHRRSVTDAIITTLHEKNPREAQHSKRVGEISRRLAKALGYTDLEESNLHLIGHLHDIGKIAINEQILNKAGPLTAAERDEVERHPEVGFRILSASYETKEIAECILSHHERWDGKGYPRGLAGEDIPLIARVVSIADAYDAMTAERPYRKPLTYAEIKNEFLNNAGTQFDPQLTQLFIDRILVEEQVRT